MRLRVPAARTVSPLAPRAAPTRERERRTAVPALPNERQSHLSRGWLRSLRSSPWASLSLSRARAGRASRAQADATVASMRVRAASIIDAVTSNSKLRRRMSSISSSLRCGSETPPTEAQ